MALKLNKGISDHMAGMLQKHMNVSVSCVAELVGATITTPNVVTELQMPYSLFQEIMDDTNVVDGTFSFGLVCAAVWSNALYHDTLVLPEDNVSFTELQQMKVVLEMGAVVTRKDAQNYLSKMLFALWNMVSGTDREQFLLKTMASAHLSDHLNYFQTDSWPSEDLPSLTAIGKALEKHITGKVDPKYKIGWAHGESSILVQKLSLSEEGTDPGMLTPDLSLDMHGAASKIMKQKPVKLAEAKAIYQPVTASSEGSVYHTVALFEGLAIAVRVQQGGGISIRAEGSNLSKAKSNMEKLGMTVKAKYASMHLHAGDALLQAKTIGSFLTGIQLPMLTPPALVSTLIGKGA